MGVTGRKCVSMKRIAILQSNYIPWKGYFDIIKAVDEFVIYDEAQYTRRDWRNRNLIKTKNGLLWLTIPVKVKYKDMQKIIETRITDNYWEEKHFESIRHNYKKAPFFESYAVIFEKVYTECAKINLLSYVNRLFIQTVCDILDIKTRITDTSSYEFYGTASEKIVGICKQAGADTYLTGPAAKRYLDITVFNAAGIKINWADYSDYPEYKQLFPPFEHRVSILDLIFNEGFDSLSYMKCF